MFPIIATNQTNMAPDKGWGKFIFLVVFCFLFLFCEVYGASPDLTNVFSSKHTNNWAVIVCTFKYLIHLSFFKRMIGILSSEAFRKVSGKRHLRPHFMKLWSSLGTGSCLTITGPTKESCVLPVSHAVLYGPVYKHYIKY